MGVYSKMKNLSAANGRVFREVNAHGKAAGEFYQRADSRPWSSRARGHSSVQRLVMAGYGTPEGFVRAGGVLRD